MCGPTAWGRVASLRLAEGSRSAAEGRPLYPRQPLGWQAVHQPTSSPADIGKPVKDFTDKAVKGKYQLRIVWFEPEKPTRRRQKIFSYVVA